MEMFEVDLRSRKDGNSVECILSTEDHDEAYKLAEKWNKENLSDYDENIAYENYINRSDGLFADVYYVDNEKSLHGVGKFN